jgi:hypothetical protein
MAGEFIFPSEGHAVEITTPPSVNQLYRNVAKVGRVKTRAYQTWLNVALWELRSLPVMTGPVIVAVQISDKHSGDIDNRLKAVLDGLVEARRIPGDHKAIVRAVSSAWSSSLPKGRARVTVAPVVQP